MSIAVDPAEAERVLQAALAGLRRLCISAAIDKSHGTTHAKRVLAHVERALLEANPRLSLPRELSVRLAALLHDADARKYFPTSARHVGALILDVLFSVFVLHLFVPIHPFLPY